MTLVEKITYAVKSSHGVVHVQNATSCTKIKLPSRVYCVILLTYKSHHATSNPVINPTFIPYMLKTPALCC